MDHETFLASEPVFTGPELAEVLAEPGVVYPVEEARRLEERWVRAGRVVAVRPDLSAVVDVGYVRRVPLWPATCRDWQRLGRWQATGVPLFDIHEGAAGKLDAAGDGALIPDEAPAAAARRSIPAVRKH